MEYYDIEKFAKLEIEREHRQTVEAIREKDPEERLRILGNVVLNLMRVELELERLEGEVTRNEDTYECLREVYADEGIDIDEIEIEIVSEVEDGIPD